MFRKSLLPVLCCAALTPLSAVAAIPGAAYDWGANGDGELGTGTTTDSSVPVQVSGLGSGVTAVAGGANHSLAIQNGAAYAWGANGTGDLGNGTMADSSVPVQVSGLGSGVTAVAGGGGHSLAIQNGAAKAWGYNGDGELGNGTTVNNSAPVQVSGLTSGVTAVAGGASHSLAIQNGAAKAWGLNSAGELGNGTMNPFSFSSVPVQVFGLSAGVTAVAAGEGHSLAIQNGNVYAWGANGYGQLGNGTTTSSSVPIEIDAVDLKNIIAIAASDLSSFALSADGSLWVWGNNNYGQLGLGTITADYLTPQHLLAPGGYIYTAIDADANGDNPVAILSAIPEPSTWVLLSAGSVAGVGLSLRRRMRRA